jgi:hypothetical protein
MKMITLYSKAEDYLERAEWIDQYAKFGYWDTPTRSYMVDKFYAKLVNVIVDDETAVAYKLRFT